MIDNFLTAFLFIESAFSKKELEQIKQKRLGKNIPASAIYTKSDGDYTTELSPNQLRVDAEKYPILADIAVLGDRVRFITLKRNLSAILILFIFGIKLPL